MRNPEGAMRLVQTNPHPPPRALAPALKCSAGARVTRHSLGGALRVPLVNP